MNLPTQTMENTTEVEYISIYDKPKRGKGRPKTCELSDEEKRERLRLNCKTYVDANPEKERERVKLAMTRIRAEAKKYNLENQLFLGAFYQMNFHLNI